MYINRATETIVALRKESVDRNVQIIISGYARERSLSARRAWIEILLVYLALIRYLSLSARRAWIEIIRQMPLTRFSPSLSARRAWIEIGKINTRGSKKVSLSARRAWIEINDDLEPSKTRRVALRKESVDRNILLALLFPLKLTSLSARRAWIEIRFRRWPIP